MIRWCLVSLLLFGTPVLLEAQAVTAVPTGPAGTVAGLMDFTFLTSGQVAGDPLFFVQDGSGAVAPLLQEPASSPILKSATLEMTYQAGKDFSWVPGSREIRLVPGSRIPTTPASGLHPAPHSPNSYDGSRDGTPWMLFGEGRFFHDRQAVASYPTTAKWPGLVPVAAPDRELGHLRQRLRARQPLRLVTLGDSISTGANASGAVGAPPLQPGYPELVALGLEKAFGIPVTRTNLSVGGMDSNWGVTQIPRVLAETPDLVLLAFGMNDASGGRTPDDFSAKIGEILSRLQTARPACTVIIVSPMTANPEWNRSAPLLYPAYAAKLASLTGVDCALADVTAVWSSVLERKSYLSLSGNGLNHPNDFGHQLYAATILTRIGGK